MKSCLTRRPREGDVVKRIDGKEDEDAHNAYTLKPGETATVMKLDDDWDFTLKDPRGNGSEFKFRKSYQYVYS